MWHVEIPAVPTPRVQLVDVLASVGLYGLILAILSHTQGIKYYHFTIAFSIALFLLTYRTYGEFRRKPEYTSVVFTHFFSAISHLIMFIYIVWRGAVPDMSVDRHLNAGEMIFSLSSFACAFVAVVGAGFDVKECISIKRKARALYGALGGFPVLVELFVVLALSD